MFINFPSYVIARNGVNLLGRNWLSEAKLDWAILFNRCEEKLNVSETNGINEKLVNLV